MTPVSPAAAADAAYDRETATGTRSSAVPCRSTMRCPTGSSRAGSAASSRSAAGGPSEPSNGRTASSSRCSRSAAARSSTPPSDTTPASRSGAGRCHGEAAGRLCRDAAQAARCPPAECPTSTVRPRRSRRSPLRADSAAATRSSTWSAQSAVSSNVPGQPPPSIPVRRYSTVAVTYPAPANASLSAVACARSNADRQNPPCTTTTSGRSPVAAGSRTSTTWSGSMPYGSVRSAARPGRVSTSRGSATRAVCPRRGL